MRKGLIDGRISIDAADVSTAAALFLREATGSVKADLSLSQVDERQIADVNATIRDLEIEQTRVSSATVAATVEDLFGVPAVVGSINAQDISTGGVDIARLEATARQNEGATDFEGTALLDQGTQLEARGALAPEGNGYRVRLNRLGLEQGAVQARLVEPTSLLVEGSAFTLDPLAIDVAGGRITAGGRVADVLDLAVSLEQVPLSIANTIQPALGLGGTLDGTAEIKGTRERPLVNFDVDGRGITSPVLAQAGLSTLTIDATGTSDGNRLNVDTSVTSLKG
ncbi:hypothetical protein [Nitratireductor aquibiodomus]|uniref:hypothetical protein n=1 Tax=Nitratireductor aquibiodomus TaxID=204799 RepID=UPI0002F2C924